MSLMDMLQARFNNMDDEEAQQMLNQVSLSQLHEGVENLFSLKVAPHLHDISDNANYDYDDPEEVREQFKQLDDDAQEELFYDTAHHLAAVLEGLRERPDKAAPELKSMLRDPYTLEALLLIYEDEHIDEEVRDQLKEFTAGYLKLYGVMLAPEMYSEQEIRETLDLHGLDGYVDG